MNLYYNAFHPIQILESLTIKCSIVTRNRGVSMSSVRLDSHGPFTFEFAENCEWSKQLQQVRYWDRLPENRHEFLDKQSMFADEFEWWSANPVNFKLTDVVNVTFRANSSGARIYPRIAVRDYKTITNLYPDLARKA